MMRENKDINLNDVNITLYTQRMILETLKLLRNI